MRANCKHIRFFSGGNIQNFLISSSPAVNLNNHHQQQEEELTEKLDEIEDLKCHYHQLQQLYKTQQDELLQLKSSQNKLVREKRKEEQEKTSNNRFISTLHEDRERVLGK